ncbi:cAMP-regulated phosphoprotein 21-like isoform X2 [Argiope bruennichi]|uniref:cAMP-regulated phosphoprotein 21-like isoform X2 n=1 Tax=Argiope bruennichi TaxID=94029 RepID=UPI00249438A5|nr:cAMP-regulated phosphoprotein 21-like isoform X2 [Argiope bruennichi]
MEPHHSRPSRLEKQEEFEVEEEGQGFMLLSPVTIQIEDRGGNQGDEDQDDKNKDSPYACDADDDSSSPSGKASNPDLSPDTMDRLTENKPERRKTSSRVKLLVRSHAVHDDASPPPDLETVIANTNMLSVTNASSFTTQTQSKGATNKIRLGNQSSSQGSTESSSASGLSRDSSTETYTDSSGIDLQQFIVDTLHKNQKDRLMLLKVEQDLTSLIKDNKRQSMKFPQMSSYNRMLVHRVAAFFGLDHYVDGNGTSVIVNKTKTTRIPDSRFQDFIRDELLPEEPKKSILKRDSISFEEGKEKSPERQSSTDSRRSKSFEEREEEYEKARARIFNQDEGLGESPLNRSQEGTHCSSRRSSQEDVRWPSSETRPWSSTDSDSSGRPLGSKLSSSFETDTPALSNKATRTFGGSLKADENKASLAPTKSTRPVMTKASSFGGISVLSRENSAGRNITPRITKAESFNVTTISSSPVPRINDAPFDSQEDASETSESPVDSVSCTTVTLQGATCQFSSVIISSDQTFPVVSGQPCEIQVPYIQALQDAGNQTATWQSGNKDVSKDFISAPAVEQPLTWPYSTGTDILFPGVFINPQAGYSRVAFSTGQPLSVSTADQVPTTIGHITSGTAPSSSTQSLQRPQTSSLQSQVQQPHTTVNTSSPTIFYVPYISQVPSSVSHPSSLAPVQSIRPQAQSAPFITEPRPLVLFPVCYLQHNSNIQPVRHAFQTSTSPSSQCPSQSSRLHVTNVEVKNHASTVTSHLLSPQYMSCFPALACTQSGDTNTLVTTASATVFPFGNVNVGNTGNIGHTILKTSFTSQPSQPSVCIQQSFMQLQTASVTLPPVYVSITSSTQSPATRTHAGGHVAAQFSSSRSQSLPVSSSSGSLNNSLNSGTPFLGYTVYAPPMQSIPSASPLTTITINQNTASAQPSQFAPAYVSAFQVLPPNVPLVANIGSNAPPLCSVIRTQYPTPISSVSKVPLSFPLVKQTSDPGIGERVTLANAVPKIFEWIRFRGSSGINDLCLVGPPMQQHLGPLLLPQPPSIARFPRASISHHSPSRPPKTRKHRSKASTLSSTTLASQSIFEGEGKRVLKVEGLPADMKRCDVEHYLESVTDIGAKIYFLSAESLKIIDETTDFIVSCSKHIVLAVFDTDTAAQNALLSIKTTKFQLRHWHCSQDCKNVKKN